MPVSREKRRDREWEQIAAVEGNPLLSIERNGDKVTFYRANSSRQYKPGPRRSALLHTVLENYVAERGHGAQSEQAFIGLRSSGWVITTPMYNWEGIS